MDPRRRHARRPSVRTNPTRSSAIEEVRGSQPALVLVAYNNIVSNGRRLEMQHLESWAIDFAMYGLQTVVLAQEHVGSKLVPVGDGRGPRRQMTPDGRHYISAVAVLDLCREGLRLTTYHNYFARVPLSIDVFRGGADMHFRKPGDPNLTPQTWEEV